MLPSDPRESCSHPAFPVVFSSLSESLLIKVALLENVLESDYSLSTTALLPLLSPLHPNRTDVTCMPGKKIPEFRMLLLGAPPPGPCRHICDPLTDPSERTSHLTFSRLLSFNLRLSVYRRAFLLTVRVLPWESGLGMVEQVQTRQVVKYPLLLAFGNSELHFNNKS